MPAGLEPFVDDLLTPKMNWRGLLWHYVTQEFITDYTWASPNRRYVQHGIYLPGVVREGMELVVCVDTSGSVDRETLSEFYAEIKGILASYENTHAHVIVCDADVTDVQDIDEFSVDRIQFKGGGGTSLCTISREGTRVQSKGVHLPDGWLRHLSRSSFFSSNLGVGRAACASGRGAFRNCSCHVIEGEK